MFFDAFDNLFKGVGQMIERDGKKYLKIDEKNWTTNDLLVMAEIVIPIQQISNQVAWNSIAEADLKVLISVKPKSSK